MPPIGNGPLVLPYPLPLPILRPPFLREVQVPQGTLSRLLARCRCQGSQPRRAGLCLSVKEPWWDSGWNRPAGGTILTAKTNTKWTRRSRERGLLGSSRHWNVQSLSKAKTSGLGEKRSSESKTWPKRGGLREGEVGTPTTCPVFRCLSLASTPTSEIITDMDAGVGKPNGNGTIGGLWPWRGEGLTSSRIHAVLCVSPRLEISVAGSFLLLRWIIECPTFSG